MSNTLPTGGLSGLVITDTLGTTERCSWGVKDNDGVLGAWAQLAADCDPLWELWCLCLSLLCLWLSVVWALLREQAMSVRTLVLTVLPLDKAPVWSAISAFENSVGPFRLSSYTCSCLEDVLTVTHAPPSSALSLFFFLWSWWLLVASAWLSETVGCELPLLLLSVVLEGSESGRSCFHFLTRDFALSPTSPSHFLRLLTSLPMWVTYVKTSEALVLNHKDRKVMEWYAHCGQRASRGMDGVMGLLPNFTWLTMKI